MRQYTLPIVVPNESIVAEASRLADLKTQKKIIFIVHKSIFQYSLFLQTNSTYKGTNIWWVRQVFTSQWAGAAAHFVMFVQRAIDFWLQEKCRRNCKQSYHVKPLKFTFLIDLILYLTKTYLTNKQQGQPTMQKSNETLL